MAKLVNIGTDKRPQLVNVDLITDVVAHGVAHDRILIYFAACLSADRDGESDQVCTEAQIDIKEFIKRCRESVLVV